MRTLILIPLLAFACTPAVAQRGFSGAHFGTRFGGGFSSHHGGHDRGWRRGYPLGPLYWDSLFPDDSFNSDYPPPAPPVVVIQQPAAPPTGTSAPLVAEPAQPLLIEMRGGRYVQLRGSENSNTDHTDQQVVPRAFPMSAIAGDQRPSAPPPPTVLIFRDGSREQIGDYTIADGVLYAQANYYTDGSWNKLIPLSSLDLDATRNENHSRAVPFQVPAAPNQVIVGP